MDPRFLVVLAHGPLPCCPHGPLRLETLFAGCLAVVVAHARQAYIFASVIFESLQARQESLFAGCLVVVVAHARQAYICVSDGWPTTCFVFESLQDQKARDGWLSARAASISSKPCPAHALCKRSQARSGQSWALPARVRRRGRPATPAPVGILRQARATLATWDEDPAAHAFASLRAGAPSLPFPWPPRQRPQGPLIQRPQIVGRSRRTLSDRRDLPENCAPPVSGTPRDSRC